MSQAKRNLKSPFLVLTSLLSLTAVGCGPAEDGAEPASSFVEPLWLWSAATKWANGNVPVCWDPATTTRTDFATLSNRIRNEANLSWPAVAKVQFTGWGTCPANTSGMVSISIDTSRINSTAGDIGFKSAGLKMILGQDGTTVPKPGVVAHELGHVLGFAHEMARSDFQDDATGLCQEGNVSGNALDTPADRSSIMATVYCHSGGDLTLWDAVGVQNAYGARSSAARPLITGYHASRGDHGTVSTSAGIAALRGAGYKWAYAEGWVFNDNIPGTVALKTYFHSGRGDFLTTASISLQQNAVAAGYSLVRTEGHLFTARQTSTVPLDMYWNAQREDHMLVSTFEAEQAALGAGYVKLHTEGFIPLTTPYQRMWVYWHPGRGDNLVTSPNSTLARAAEAAGYQFAGFDGAFWQRKYPDTVPLKTFWHGTREDHFALATSTSEADAVAAGYSNVRSEGFVYFSSQPGMAEFFSYWHPQREDHFTTMTRGTDAHLAGYSRVRREGWAVPTQ